MELADLKTSIQTSGLTQQVDTASQLHQLEALNLSDGALEDLIRIIRKDRETKQ